MKINVPDELKDISAYFPSDVYIVGGFVRDSLLGYVSHDIDLTGDYTPDQVKSFFKNSPYSVHDGSKKFYTLIIKGRLYSYEFTSFRLDSYRKGHSPEESTLTHDIGEDASRRDFTINAIYYNLKTGNLVDPFNGLCDLNSKIIKTTRKAHLVFSEDGLRLMRLCRFASSLGFKIEASTFKEAKNHASLIKDISPERIKEELDKILLGDTTYGIQAAHSIGLDLLTKIGVNDYILPDLVKGIGMEQRPDYHKYDVYTHILKAVEYSDPEVRLAALFHDIAKPYCKLTTGKYRGHDIEGYRMTIEIMTGLRYPTELIYKTATLVKHHMFNLDGNAKINTIRHFVQENSKIIPELVKLKYADSYGTGLVPIGSKIPTADILLDVLNDLNNEGVPFSISDLLVDGNDLINIPSIPATKRSEVLFSLLKACSTVDSPLAHSREKQLNFLNSYRF